MNTNPYKRALLIAAILLISHTAYGFAAAEAPDIEAYPMYGFIADVADSMTADEEYNPLQTSFTLSSSELLNAGEYQAAIMLQNQGDDVICDVTLFNASGDVLWGPHDLNLSEGYTWRGALTITEDMLETGAAACTVTYVLAKGDPEFETQITKQLTAAIAHVDAKPAIEFSRSQSMTYAQAGQDVTITYTVKNTGNVTLTNIVISDALFGTVQRISELEVDEKQTFTRRLTVGTTAVTSQPSVSYSYAGSTQRLSQEIAPSTIRIAQPNLEILLESDATLVKSGDTIMLRCRLVNNGNVGYRKIQLSDQILGDLGFVDDLKPGRDIVYAKSVRIQSRTTFKFTITAKDTTGSDVTAVSNSLTIDTVSENARENLSLTVLADKTQVKSGEPVSFTLSLSNDGTDDIADVTLSERSHGIVGHVNLLKAGEVRTFNTRYTVTGYEIFTFTASMTQSDGARREALSEPISVSIGTPEVTDEPTAAPTAVPTATISPTAARAFDALTRRIMTYAMAFAALILILITVIFFANRARDRDRRRKAARRSAQRAQHATHAEADHQREEDIRIYEPRRTINVTPAEKKSRGTSVDSK